MAIKESGLRPQDTWLVQIARDTGYKLATHDTGLLAQWPEHTLRVG